MEAVDNSYELDINPEKVCRLCLSPASDLLNIYSRAIVDGYILSVPEMLKFTVDIAVSTDDKLPDKICNACKKQIITFYTFKQKTKRTEQSLLSMFRPEALNKKQNFTGKTITCAECNAKFDDENQFTEHMQQDHVEMVSPIKSNEKESDTEGFIFEASYEPEYEYENDGIITEGDTSAVDEETPPITISRKRPARSLPTRSSKRKATAKGKVTTKETKPLPSTSTHETVFKLDLDDNLESNDDDFSLQELDGDSEPTELYECHACPMQFLEKDELEVHIREHEDFEYQCEGCNELFGDEEQWMSHDCLGNDDKYDGTDGDLNCVPCNKRMKSSAQLHQHNKMHDSMSVIISQIEFYPCHDCCLLFVTRENLHEHNVEMHPDKVNLDTDADNDESSVKKIDESCTDYQFLDDDKLADFKDEAYSCGECGSSYPTIMELKNHVIFHATKFPCPIYECGCQYDQLTRLTIHVLNKHINRKNLQCLHCSLAFPSYDELQAHLKDKCKEKKYQCYECEKKFFSKKALVTHLRTLKEKKFSCDLCDKKFKQQGELKIHLRSHTNERPFQCTICSKAYKTSSMRAAHMDSHITGKTFECTMCDKKLQSRTSYRNHMKRHTSDKKHECQYCSRKFFTRYHLNLHQSKMHKNQVKITPVVLVDEAADETDDMIVYE